MIKEEAKVTTTNCKTNDGYTTEKSDDKFSEKSPKPFFGLPPTIPEFLYITEKLIQNLQNSSSENFDHNAEVQLPPSTLEVISKLENSLD
jgi:hypothetical protein